MSDNTIRDRAIEAAAREMFQDNERKRAEAWGDNNARPWDAIEEAHQRPYRDGAAPLVDAVLAVALPEWRKHAFELRKTAIREARAEAWDEGLWVGLAGQPDDHGLNPYEEGA